uniref:Si:ch211-133n4.10 n=2 Tax=Kryptolebias marmoratus TaxID=37003 RepID=A0A3Q2ZRC5_KRYMA
MSECDQFFLHRTPPRVPGILEDGTVHNQNRYKPICQTYRNRMRFITLYDVRNRIPVFSAFRFVEVKDSRRPRTQWRIEPQLEKENANRNMINLPKHKTFSHQAVSTDYRSNRTFDRGHIFPSSYASTAEDKKSTFTLTNIVPQAESFNKGSWGRMERCTRCVMEKYCINSNGATEGFGVIGAQPSVNQTLNNRVNIPSVLWSAFCCYNANAKAWMASAHWGDNVPDESKNKHLETKTLEELQDRLRTADSDFQVFPGTNCPLNTTVSGFYPEMENCDCPPSSSKPRLSTLTSDSVSSTSASVPYIYSSLLIYTYHCIF